jgi:CHASE2 domain-containing sensor protein
VRKEEVIAMSNRDLVPAPAKTSVTEWVAYLFIGGAAGFVLGIATVFPLVFFIGSSIGLSSSSCTVFACMASVLLSQPAGIIGMVVGATVGVVAGGVVHYTRYFWHK